MSLRENSSVDSDWEDEATSVMQDVKNHVHRISISNLPSSKTMIFFNMTTLEMKDFCVELTRDGFRIVGEEYDSEEKRGKYPVFETPYSMLDNLSPAYRDSFGESLLEKLTALKREREANQELGQLQTKNQQEVMWEMEDQEKEPREEEDPKS